MKNPGFLDKVALERLQRHKQFIMGSDGDYGTNSTEWRMPSARIANLVYHGHCKIEVAGGSTFATLVKQ